MLKHNDPTPTPIDGYLADLRRRLEAELPAERVDDLVAETESHLLERAEALRELESEAPELEAVRGFVEASSQASELVESDAAERWALRARRLRLPAFCLLLFTLAAAPFAASPLPDLVQHLPLVLLYELIALAMVAYFGRLPDSRRLRRTAFMGAAAVGLLISVTLVDKTAENGPAGTRWEIAAQAAMWNATAIAHEERARDILQEWRSWTRTGRPLHDFPEGSAPYSIPPAQPILDGSDATMSRTEAGRAWQERGRRWASVVQSRAEQFRERQRSLASAAATMPDLFAGTAAAALTLLIGMLGLLVDLGFSRLGMRLFRRRKRSRACS